MENNKLREEVSFPFSVRSNYEEIVTYLYRMCLNREPDSSGLNYYLDTWNTIGGKQAIEEEFQTFYTELY